MLCPSLPAAAPSRLALAWCLSGLALLSACGKVQEAATEKMIEKSITQDGGSAKVDIQGGGGVKAEGVDKDGQAYKVEIGQAQVTEKELGLAFYPGAQHATASRMDTGDGRMVQVELTTGDDLAKVTEWYRAQLKGRAGAGAQSMEQVSAESAMLMLGQGDNESLVVNISKDGNSGTRISLMHGSKAAKAP